MSVFDDLTADFLAKHPIDAAQFLERLPPEDAAALLSSCDIPAAAGSLAAMEPALGSRIVAAFEPGFRSRVANELHLDIAVGLLRRLGAAERGALLEAFPPRHRSLLERKLTFPEDTVGSLADPNVPALPDDLTVKQARRRIRDYAKSLQNEAYVLDRSQKLTGVLGLRELALASAGQGIRDLVRPAEQNLSARMQLDVLRNREVWRRHEALPVIDGDGVFVGALMRDAMEQYCSKSSAERAGVDASAVAFGLAELYWVGMTEFLGGLSSGLKISRPPDSEGGGA